MGAEQRSDGLLGLWSRLRLWIKLPDNPAGTEQARAVIEGGKT